MSMCVYKTLFFRSKRKIVHVPRAHETKRHGKAATEPYQQKTRAQTRTPTERSAAPHRARRTDEEPTTTTTTPGAARLPPDKPTQSGAKRHANCTHAGQRAEKGRLYTEGPKRPKRQATEPNRAAWRKGGTATPVRRNCTRHEAEK